MDQQGEQQKIKPLQQAENNVRNAEAQGDGLLARAQEAQSEQAGLIEASPVASQYSSALAAQVEAKHDQAERIEDKLETLIEQQTSCLQQARLQQPGLIALPKTRQRWQQQLQQQQRTMQRLQGRLEVVREIKDGMSAHGPRIEEMATRKLRAQQPELASEWDELQEAQRLHQGLQRKQKLNQERMQREQRSVSNRLGLSQALVIGAKS